jgi:DNA helicase-2/ATP-dependent DNA helicase PcrA
MKKAGRCLNGIAILCRAHFLSLELQLALAEAGLPVQLATGAEPFFYQPHIRVAIDCLRLQTDPEHAEALESINRLLPETGTDAGKEHWQQVREALLELRAAPMSGAIRLLREGWVGKTLSRQYPEEARIMEDLEILAAFLGAFADREGFFTKMKRMGSPSRRRGEDPQPDRLWLGTVHQAKGLEFPVVFIPGLVEGCFPLRRAVDKGQLEEERRLFYVAVTRAMDELILSSPQMLISPKGKRLPVRPSPFIDELPPGLFNGGS